MRKREPRGPAPARPRNTARSIEGTLSAAYLCAFGGGCGLAVPPNPQAIGVSQGEDGLNPLTRRDRRTKCSRDRYLHGATGTDRVVFLGSGTPFDEPAAVWRVLATRVRFGIA